MKRALLVGINKYKMSGCDLRGCVNDVKAMEAVSGRHGFNTMTILLNEAGTMSNIIEEFTRLVSISRKNDEVLYYHSGHGSQVPDFSGEEIDGLDECIVTYDHDWEDALTDDKLAKVIEKLPPGAHLSLILDTCHSGTLTDTAGVKSIPMPYEYQRISTGRDLQVTGFGFAMRSESKQRHILFSGCDEGEYSYETKYNRKYCGFMTNSFCIVDYQYKRSIHDWSERLSLVKSIMKKSSIPQTPIMRAPYHLTKKAVLGGM